MMKDLARERGGECLSDEYVNTLNKLKWKCSDGHVWEAASKEIVRGHWCPICANKSRGRPARWNIQIMKDLARERGGECLSDEYVNTLTKLKWKCSDGHVWEAPSKGIVRGHWCPTCALKSRGRSQRLSIKDCQEIAEQRGGKCLSKTYTNAITKLKWQCAEGHIWEAKFSDIKNGQQRNSNEKGHWCPYCAGRVRGNLQECHDLAEKRGWKCLSKEYVNRRQKLKWQCSEGHTWEAPFQNIRNGSGCPRCNFFWLSEEICRTTFEQLFQKKFPKRRPRWLRGISGRTLELDGYCKELRLAFEYQGEQHYQTNFYSDASKLMSRFVHDEIKLSSCRDKGICLIVIKYTDDLEKLPKLIKKECRKFGLDIGSVDFDRTIDFNKAHRHKRQIDKFRKIAQTKGGVCLSDRYLGDGEKLTFQCSEGHVWEAQAGKVKRQGTWCPVCGFKTVGDKLRRWTIKDCQEIAEQRGGKCLSKKYVKFADKLKWQCGEGHIWEASFRQVKHSGSWCPKCGPKIAADKRRGSLKEYQAIAEERGGKCLSTRYVNSKEKLKWQCAKGHIWETTPMQIKHSGSWCPVCGYKTVGDKLRRYSVKDCQEIAEQRGGKCLSKKYVKYVDKLKWQCGEGHIWETSFREIQSGTWCPKCGRKTIADKLRGSLKEYQAIAEEKGGKCLSKTYTNAITKLKWQCAKGHIWKATPVRIKHANSWCPQCAKYRKRFGLNKNYSHPNQQTFEF